MLANLDFMVTSRSCSSLPWNDHVSPVSVMSALPPVAKVSTVASCQNPSSLPLSELSISQLFSKHGAMSSMIYIGKNTNFLFITLNSKFYILMDSVDTRKTSITF